MHVTFFFPFLFFSFLFLFSFPLRYLVFSTTVVRYHYIISCHDFDLFSGAHRRWHGIRYLVGHLPELQAVYQSGRVEP
ncbi:uncharacterized protein BDW47DRAFT_104757 [Aspergillus candidus]|uniref:Uncharacterized protein n=1 Tax=Aspergillus candidus TaxID=41067 RepID=A0A2I2FDN8_ASPCN|nr:hypothetical protein BDW47DRAFT_104757 [Aspergillus candidus]PLB38727.1 hypothetical protein BDW47DRAFT_104757 [Aspergillus candidus]